MFHSISLSFLCCFLKILLTVLPASVFTFPLDPKESLTANLTTPEEVFYRNCLAAFTSLPSDPGPPSTIPRFFTFASSRPPAYSRDYVLPRGRSKNNCVISLELIDGLLRERSSWMYIKSQLAFMNYHCRLERCQEKVENIGIDRPRGGIAITLAHRTTSSNSTQIYSDY